MTEFSVELEFTQQTTSDMTNAMDDLLERLAEYAAVASYGSGTLGVRLCVQASSAPAAVDRAIQIVMPAMRKAGIGLEQLILSSAETTEELERRLTTGASGGKIG